MTVIKPTMQEAGRRKSLPQLGRSRRCRIDRRAKITSRPWRGETSKEMRWLLNENDCQSVEEYREVCIRKLERGKLFWGSPVVLGNGKPEAKSPELDLLDTRETWGIRAKDRAILMARGRNGVVLESWRASSGNKSNAFLFLKRCTIHGRLLFAPPYKRLRSSCGFGSYVRFSVFRGLLRHR